MQCPADKSTLRRTESPSVFGCSQCEGRLVAFREVERKIPAVRSRRFFDSVAAASEQSKRVCPVCGKAFLVVYTVTLGKFIELDACVVCRQIWFDRGEDEDLLTEHLSNSEIDQLYKALAISEAKFRYWHVLRARGRWGLAILYAVVLVIALGLVREYFELQDFNRKLLSGEWKPPIVSEYGRGRGAAGYLFLDTPYRNSALLMIALVILFETRSRNWFFAALAMAAFAMT